MPAHPYFDPDRVSKGGQESLLLILGAPFVSCLAVLGAILATGAVPSLLLLRCDGVSPALDLLKTYRAGFLLTCVICVPAPALYAALNIFLYRRWGRKLGYQTSLVSVPAFTIISFVMLFLVVVTAWGGVLGAAKLPKLCLRYSADIRQIKSGTLEHMTLLLDEKATPASMPGAPPNELTVHRRGASGPDTDFEWMTLRFPDALEFDPAPEGFMVIGQTYGWNWDHQQQYEVYYTSEFHLVEKITPVP